MLSRPTYARGGGPSGVSLQSAFASIPAASTFRIILRFLMPSTMYEMAVSQMVSSPVHVDVVLDMDGTPNKNFAYTAYAQEKFSMTLMPSSMAKNPNFRSMCLDISEAEFHRCSLYLSKMVGRVEYNYTDAMFLLPAIGSGPISDVMVPDVDSSSPEMLEKVFCSQAALLVLKNCLSENEALMVALKGLNSRLTSPSILYRSIQGVFERMDDECP